MQGARRGGQRGPPAPRSRPGSGPRTDPGLKQSCHSGRELRAALGPAPPTPTPAQPPLLGADCATPAALCTATRAWGAAGGTEARAAPLWLRPSRLRRESCCSTLRNAEPKRRREEAAGDDGDSRRGPRRGGARRTPPKCKQRSRPGKRGRPTPRRARGLEVTTTRAAAGATWGCDGPSRRPGNAGPRKAPGPGKKRPLETPRRREFGFSVPDQSPTPECLVNIVGAQDTFLRD